MREYSFGIVRGLSSNLTPELADDLISLGAPRAYENDAKLYRQGDNADYVYFLLHGRVKSTLIGTTGQETILRIHLSQSILGLTALGSDPIRDADATCMDPVRAVPVHRSDFLGLMQSKPEFGIHIAMLLIDRMSDFHFRVGDWLAQTVEQRLARALVALSTPDEDSPDSYTDEIPLTHDELAQLINARRPTVSKVLSRLASLGYVEQSGRRLTVSDRIGLIAFAETPKPG